jgi:hypothetical protein
MTVPSGHPDAAHAAEEPGFMPEYGNDTGFAADVLGVEPVVPEVSPAPAVELPDDTEL